MLHGRGYTCCSMRSTERRCRRRIGCTMLHGRRPRAPQPSARAPPARPLPVDLGVALAKVQRTRRSPGGSNSSRSTRAVASSTSAAALGARELGPGELGVVERGELVAVARRRRRPRAARPSPRGLELGRRARRASRTVVVGRPAARRRAPAGSARRTPRGGGRRAPPRRARLVWRSGYATRSRLGTPTTGMRSACAITLAVVTPTRRPVNSPGPMPDRDRGELVERRRRARRTGTAIAGASCSAWRRPPARLHLAEHASPSPTDRDAHDVGRGVDREQQHRRVRFASRRRPTRRARRRAPPTTRPDGVERDARASSSSSAGDGRAHLEPVGRQQRARRGRPTRRP